MSSGCSDRVGATRRERMHQQVVAEIKVAALEELRAHGPSGVTMRAVARSIDITPSGLYRYVEDHRSLLGLLAADAYDSMLVDLGAAADTAPVTDHARRFHLSCIALRAWSLAHQEEHSLLVSPTAMKPRPRVVAEADLRVLAHWSRLCAAAIEAGQLDPSTAGFPIAEIAFPVEGVPPEATSLAVSGLAAMSGHIAVEIRYGTSAVDAPGDFFSGYALAIMRLMGFAELAAVREVTGT